MPTSSVDDDASNLQRRPVHEYVKRGTGAAFAVATPLNSSRFAVPVPTPASLPAVARSRSAVHTAAGVAARWPCRYNAAAPATCGEAMEVPLSARVAVDPPTHADFTSTPGANRSTQPPKFANDAA